MDRGQRILTSFVIALTIVNSVLYIRVQNLEERMNELGEIENRIMNLNSSIIQLGSELDEIHDKILSLNSSITQLGTEIIRFKQTMKRPLVVVRIDDISDNASPDAVLFLLRYNIASGIPMSLGVIVNSFSADKGLVELVSSTLEHGSDVLVHGWEHENMTKLLVDEQEKNLINARERLKEALGINVTMLAPPYLAYNKDTLTAMQRTGYDVISADIYMQKSGLITDGIIGVPTTVTMSTLVNEMWQVKSLDVLMNEITLSIGFHGYAVILTHPQEFVRDGVLDKDVVTVYGALMERLRGSYLFTTLSELRKELMSR